ncbi:MAG: PilZ domain-containing protein [Pseudomonas sp.]|uniref:PilZ domain-containing protein n=1 Tax=Pseudomonas abieticivorans TaxID=2931382 RepID=UPI0020BEB1D5|nr:PilZ domain-containing protein [Pseudomonas sp. PIA16]MDE1163927.1 PilZ domain-containing protein [Pseudomonas sp.]
MYTERRIERHQLPYYLKLFNRYTGQPMGYLGNICEEGLMLISDLPLLVGADFELQLKIPGSEGGVHHVNLTATCLWCHEDVTPSHYDSGFMLLKAPAEFGGMVDALRHYFSFYPLSASA